MMSSPVQLSEQGLLAADSSRPQRPPRRVSSSALSNTSSKEERSSSALSHASSRATSQSRGTSSQLDRIRTMHSGADDDLDRTPTKRTPNPTPPREQGTEKDCVDGEKRASLSSSGHNVQGSRKSDLPELERLSVSKGDG